MQDIDKMYQAFKITEDMTKTFRSISEVCEGKRSNQSNYRISTIVLTGSETDIEAEVKEDAKLG
jgi:hypothetical protein